MADFSAMRLGLLPPKVGLKLPGMARLGVELPTAKPVVDWSRAVSQWGTDDNLKIGDCVFATTDHARRLWHANCKTPYEPASNDELVAAYSRVTGYDPRDPSTDQGTHWTDALAVWRSEGFILGAVRDQISAYVSLDIRNVNELKLAVQWFGCAMIGVTLPVSAQGQDTWSAVSGNDGGVWGGHAIPIVGYDPDTVSVVSWGHVMYATWPFVRKYLSEAYAVLSPDWIAGSGSAPDGLDLAALNTDLDALAA